MKKSSRGSYPKSELNISSESYSDLLNDVQLALFVSVRVEVATSHRSIRKHLSYELFSCFLGHLHILILDEDIAQTFYSFWRRL